MDERAYLLEALVRERNGVRNAASGLTDEQARLTPTVSRLSVGGIVKHLTVNEDGWVSIITGSFDDRSYAAAANDPVSSFRLADSDTLHDVLERYDEATKATDALVATYDDMSRTVPIPESMRAYVDTDVWSMRWILLQMITETSRHAGHADIIRESIDGADARGLMASAER
jgi:uncharacterized damage-inducible protein DinB